MYENLEITKKTIRKWSPAEMKEYMKDPATNAKIEEVLFSTSAAELFGPVSVEEAVANAELPVQPTEAEIAEEAAKAEAAAILAAQAVADAAAAEEAAKEAEEIRLAAEKEAAKPKKVVLDYQIEDEQGNPIGRRTHLEASDWESMAKDKLVVAHIEATRAFDRLKKRKDNATFKRPEVEVTRMTDEEMLRAANELKSDDESVALAAQRKIEADRIIQDRQANLQAAEDNRQKAVSNDFMRNHLADFLPCKANGEIIGSYIRENNLEWTIDNLEIAFAAVEKQLAPVPQKLVEHSQPAAPAVNPQAAAAPTVVPAAPVASAIPVAPASNTPAAAPRRVNGGLIPGESVTGRPSVSKAPGLTKKDIAKWDGPTMLKEMKSSPARRAEIERVLATR